MPMRLIKIVLVSIAAMFATLVAFNNITDYGSNFDFVQHVLLMDTTFPENEGMWRAIESPTIHHAGYALIILTEFSVALLGWLGTYAMWSARNNDHATFDESKLLAAYALLLGIVLWFGGFIVVGGEWFLMWQSNIWNGTSAAFRISAMFALFLIVLISPDPDLASES